MNKERDDKLQDLATYGVSFSKGGQRIDPRDVYISTEPEQEPVAWITEWVQRYRHNDTPIMDRAVSFTKGDAPAVPNPNYIPLYPAPPKREPLSDEAICDILIKKEWKGFVELVRIIEKAHGIGGGE